MFPQVEIKINWNMKVVSIYGMSRIYIEYVPMIY
jgi:hypothetical protein